MILNLDDVWQEIFDEVFVKSGVQGWRQLAGYIERAIPQAHADSLDCLPHNSQLEVEGAYALDRRELQERLAKYHFLKQKKDFLYIIYEGAKIIAKEDEADWDFSQDSVSMAFARGDIQLSAKRSLFGLQEIATDGYPFKQAEIGNVENEIIKKTFLAPRLRSWRELSVRMASDYRDAHHEHIRLSALGKRPGGYRGPDMTQRIVDLEHKQDALLALSLGALVNNHSIEKTPFEISEDSLRDAHYKGLVVLTINRALANIDRIESLRGDAASIAGRIETLERDKLHYLDTTEAILSKMHEDWGYLPEGEAVADVLRERFPPLPEYFYDMGVNCLRAPEKPSAKSDLLDRSYAISELNRK